MGRQPGEKTKNMLHRVCCEKKATDFRSSLARLSASLCNAARCGPWREGAKGGFAPTDATAMRCHRCHLNLHLLVALSLLFFPLSSSNSSALQRQHGVARPPGAESHTDHSQTQSSRTARTLQENDVPSMSAPQLTSHLSSLLDGLSMSAHVRIH